ncbi:MAG TPA: hypothetical protein VMF89_03060 [Polyangiales bacterium]|nr:hypothetical protein [Polyangiales bacterium]
MSNKVIQLHKPQWGTLKLVAAGVASVLLLPVLLLAVLPMLIMFVPIAVVAIPVIAPVMFSGKLAARWEHEQRKARAQAATHIKSTPVVVR